MYEQILKNQIKVKKDKFIKKIKKKIKIKKTSIYSNIPFGTKNNKIEKKYNINI